MSAVISTERAAGLRRFKPYSVYKDSGVEWLGEVPAHWEEKRLRFVCRVNPSKAEISALPRTTEVSFLPMEAIGEDGKLNHEETRTLDQVWQGYTYFRDDDVLVAKITPCFENGKGALCKGLTSGVGFGTTELEVIRPGDALWPPFVLYLTRSHPFRNLGIASMKGVAGQQRVTEDFIKDFKACFPTINEQRAIAAFLDRETAKIDMLVAKKERLIELLQEKRSALITQAVTKGLDPASPMKTSGIKWIGKIPAHWLLLQLNRVINKFVDYRGATPEKALGGIPLVTARNIKNGAIDMGLSSEFIREEDYDEWMVRGLPDVGDVVLTTEAPLGESAQITDTRIALAQRIILFKANRVRITNDYLKYHFASHSGIGELWSRATGSTAIGIKASHLKQIFVTVPPLNEQEAITGHIDGETAKLDALIAKVQEGIEKLKDYRTALISAAVTGKIDV